MRHRHDVRQHVPVETIAFVLENRVKYLTSRHPQPKTPPPAQLPSGPPPGRTP
ncbi:hypothetical protein [Streptomyces sviceus]|uniref:hypothetical protein n=1 Tax=Streptomyces sviceus TaxID=285530 RepID=UPI00367DE0A3